jgi:membrane-bound lytic murein transglycosylase D
MKLQIAIALLITGNILTGCSSPTIQEIKLTPNPVDHLIPKTDLEKALTLTEPVLHYTLNEVKEIDLTASIKNDDNEDIWQRIINKYQLNQGVSPRIQREIDFYRAHQRTLPEVFSRAKPYLFIIVDELEKRNMPMELAFLPVIESAFHPRALSDANAAGMWQFTSDTARVRGIKNNWWFDGRRDVYLSTMAALDYLQMLHQQFDGNWLYALAAYNSGSLTVKNAINKNKKRGKPTDYWSLILPGETMRYVPKLLAVAHMVKAPDSYRLNLPNIPNMPYLTRIEIDQQIDLSAAAKMADMSWEEFHLFNAGHKRITTDPSGTSHLLVPIDKLNDFAVNIAKFAPQTSGNWISHTCGLNDSLESLAKRYETTPEVIMRINKLASPHIKIGQSLLIASKQINLDTDTEEHAQSTLNSALSLEHREQQNAITRKEQREQTHKTKTLHTLVKGQTLNSVASRYHISLQALIDANHISAKTQLKAGQRLIIPTNGNSAKTPTTQNQKTPSSKTTKPNKAQATKKTTKPKPIKKTIPNKKH